MFFITYREIPSTLTQRFAAINETRPSQNELRWPLSFRIRLKSFGFSSKKEFTNFFLQISSL